MSERTPKDDPVYDIGKDPVNVGVQFDPDSAIAILEWRVVEAAVVFQKACGPLHGLSPEARKLDETTRALIAAREKNQNPVR